MKRDILLACFGASAIVGFSGTAQAQESCPQLIADVEARRQIPRGLLMAIAVTESGYNGRPNPYAMNIAGKSYHARDTSDMAQVIQKNWSRGVTSIDVGCMQINLKYHGEKFSRLTDLLNSATNVEYGASYLIQLATASGSWREGVMDYHNKNSQARRRWYGCKVWNNYLRINAQSTGYVQCGSPPGGSSVASNAGKRINTSPLVIAGYNAQGDSVPRQTHAAAQAVTFQTSHVAAGGAQPMIGGVPIVNAASPRQTVAAAVSAPGHATPMGSPLDAAPIQAATAEIQMPTYLQPDPNIRGQAFDVTQPRQRVMGKIELASPGTEMAPITTSSDARASAFQAVRPMDWSERIEAEAMPRPEPAVTSIGAKGFARASGPTNE